MVNFSSDGRWMAAAGQGGAVSIQDRRSGTEVRVLSTGSDLTGVWFSPDSDTIATAHINGTILLWSVSTGRQLASMSGPKRAVQWLDFSPDGQRIASCTTDMMLDIWDIGSASEVYSIRAHNGPVMCVRFSPDGTRIATCGQDSLVNIWEGQTAPTTTGTPE